MTAMMRLRWLVPIAATAALIMVIGPGQRASGQPLDVPEVAPEVARKEFDQAIANARDLLGQKEYDDALGNINKVIRDLESADTDIEDVSDLKAAAQLVRGDIYTAMKQWRAAIDSYNSAISDGEKLDDSAKARARNGRGEAYLELGDPSSAMGDFSLAAQIDWKNKKYLYNQGSTLVKLRAAQQAIEMLDRVLKMDNQYADAYDARGQAHGLLSQTKPAEFNLAMADFAAALKIDPEKKEYYYNAGIVLMQNQRLTEAIASFTAALAKDQAQRAAKSGQAAADATTPAADATTPAADATAPAADATTPAADAATAETASGPAAGASSSDEEQGPYIQPLLARSLAYTELGKKTTDADARAEAYRRAVADTETALDLVPQMPDALLMRGVALRLLENYDESIASFTEALRINPEYSEAIYRRGIVWYHLGENQVALDDLIEASQLTPDDVRPYMWQGFTHARLGNFYAAVNAYAQAIEHDAHFPTAYDNRGLAYLRLGQYDKAIADFDQVLRIEPTNAGAYFKRGVAHDLAGNDALAIESYLAAIRINPDYADAYGRLADAYQRQGKRDAADQARRDADAARAREKENSQQPPAGSPELGRQPASLPHSLPTAEPPAGDLFGPPGGDLFSPPGGPAAPDGSPLPGFETPHDQASPGPLDLTPQGDHTGPTETGPGETAPTDQDVPLF